MPSAPTGSCPGRVYTIPTSHKICVMEKLLGKALVQLHNVKLYVCAYCNCTLSFGGPDKPHLLKEV